MRNLLYLIRHPAVQQDLAVSAPHWQLSELGLRQSQALAGLPIWEETPVDIIYSSAEMKAIQTAEVISRQHRHLKRHSLVSLNEAQRSTEFLSVEEYQNSVRNFFEHPDRSAAPGWERSAAVRNLVAGAYQQIVADLKQHGKSAAIISHGMALTLLRAYILNRPATTEDWRKIPFAGWATVDITSGKLIQDFQPVIVVESGLATNQSKMR